MAQPGVVAALLWIHVVTVVMMAAPYYNLAIVAGRSALKTAPLAVDRYFESLIRGNAVRCFVFLATVLGSGLGILWAEGELTLLGTSWVLQAKFALLIVLAASLSTVHFGIQPRIDQILAGASGDAVPADAVPRLGRLRRIRRRMAGACLFVVLTLLAVALQFRGAWTPSLFLGMEALAAGFAYLAYRRGTPLGWL